MAERLANIIKKPKELMVGALQMIKGQDVQNLVESFTSEMTMVAEGLYDDQMRLRREVEELSSRQENLSRQALDAREDMYSRLDQSQKELVTRISDMQKRLQALESKQGKQGKKNGVLSQVTVLAAIVAGAWIIVTVLNLLK